MSNSNSNAAFTSFLNALGSPQAASLSGNGPFRCPLHDSQIPTLMLLPGGPFGHYFRCLFADCRFAGGPVELLQAVRHLDVETALAAFTAGHEFAGSCNTHLTPPIYNQFLASYRTQAELVRYIADSHARLLSNGEYLLGYLDTLGVHRNYLPATGCGKVDFPSAPAVLHLATDRQGLNGDALLLPYYNGATITHLGIYRVLGERTELYPLADGLDGIFLERQLSWPQVDRVLLCQNELDALRIYCQASTLMTQPPNPIVVNNYAALGAIHGLQEVVLLHHDDAKVALKNVLRCRHAIKPLKLKLSVVAVPGPLRTIKPTTIDRFAQERVDALAWLADQVHSLYADGYENVVHDLVAQHMMEEDRQLVLELLGKQTPVSRDLLELLQLTRCELSDRMIARKVVRRSDAGYQLIHHDRIVTLNNFTLHPIKFVKLTDGKVNVHFRVKLAGSPALSLPIEMPEAKLRTGNRRLAHTIWTALREQGFRTDTVPDAQSLEGFDWLDLLQHFDHAPFFAEIDKLGVLADQVIFPGFTIDLATGTLRPPREELHIGTAVRQMHSAAGGGSTDLEPWRRLLAATDPTSVAVAGGIAHIVHSLVARTSLCSKEWSPVHLIYSSSSDGDSLWEDAFRALCGIFSPAQDAPRLPADNSFDRLLTSYTGLGNLPFFGRVAGENRRLLDWLNGCSGPAILLANLEASHHLGRLPTTCVSVYDLQAFEHYPPQPLPFEELGALRGSFGHLLAKVLSTITPKRQELNHRLPPLVGYDWLCRVLALTPLGAVTDSFHEYPTVDWMETPEGFLQLLSEAFSNRKNGYTVCKNYPSTLNNPNALGWYDPAGDVVLRRLRTMRAVNREALQPLREKQVEARLVKFGVVAGNMNCSPIWTLKRDVWDRLVLKRIRVLQPANLVPPAAAVQ